MNPGTPQEIVSLLLVRASIKLPVSYTIVPSVFLKKKSVAVPTYSASVSFSKTSELMKETVLLKQNWLEHAIKVMTQDVIDREDSVTSAAYYASRCDADNYCPTFTQLMPKSCFSINVERWNDCTQMKATQHLNPGQIPVTAFDVSLFTLAELVQWKWPDTHGESKRGYSSRHFITRYC